MKIKLPHITMIIGVIIAIIVVPVMANQKKAKVEETEVVALKENVTKPVTFTEIVEETSSELETIVVEEPKEEVKEEPFISKYDFEALREENSDIVAWIEVPGTTIDYPILYDGTDKYLHMNLGGEQSYAGSIYVDATAEVALEENINIIYGHHMKNGSMFAAVDDFSYEDFWNNHQDIDIYMENKDLHLTPALCVVGKSDISLRDIKSIADLEEFCDGKTITNGEIPNEWDDLFVLVTCNYTGDNYRTYLFCKTEA